MLKENLQKIADIFKVKEGDNKRKIENLVVFVVILIVTIIMINAIWNNDDKTKENLETNPEKVLANTNLEQNTNNTDTTENLEQKLKNILSKIEGVGKVEVLITYSESSQISAMYNEDNTKNDTEEKDTSRW